MSSPSSTDLSLRIHLAIQLLRDSDNEFIVHKYLEANDHELGFFNDIDLKYMHSLRGKRQGRSLQPPLPA
jgi:hypothetical protein